MQNDHNTVPECGLTLCQGKLGELLVSLCYQPTAECITVIVARARELKSKDINGLSGAYRFPVTPTLGYFLQQLDQSQHVLWWWWWWWICVTVTLYFVFRAVISTLGLTVLYYCIFICILNCLYWTNKDGWIDICGLCLFTSQYAQSVTVQEFQHSPHCTRLQTNVGVRICWISWLFLFLMYIVSNTTQTSTVHSILTLLQSSQLNHLHLIQNSLARRLL